MQIKPGTFLSILLKIAPTFLCLFSFNHLEAYPDAEKTALDLSSVTTQVTDLFLDEDGRFLYLTFGNDILRMDTETWDLASEQVPALVDNTDDDGEDLSGDVGGIAIRGDALFATQNDGDLITVDLTDITAEPTTTHLIDGALGLLVADTEAGADDDKLYVLDTANAALKVFDVGDAELGASIDLIDGAGQKVTPVALALVSFPTSASTATTDKIFITTNNGLVLVINEGSVGIDDLIQVADTNKELPALSVTSNRSFIMVVDATDGVVHVIDTNSNTEIDMDSTEDGVNPVTIEDNSTLEDILVIDVEQPTDNYAFVSGSGGVTVMDLNIAATTLTLDEIFDFNDGGDDDETEDPMALSSAPGPLVASSAADGYIYSSNGDASISVITDNPFITIGSTSLGTGALTTDGSFTMTFQSDEAGTYSVKVGGDLSGSGTEVTTGTVDTASTDVTTASISYDADNFDEGSNRVFIFVTDADGNVGRDAVDITVDTPPPTVEITDTGFGTEKISVTFNRLTASDMDHYNIYVDVDATVVTTKTEVSKAVSQPSSGDTVTAIVADLVNGTPYFIAMESVDASGNVSAARTTTLTSGVVATATPEETVGLAGSLGEAGCSLNPRVTTSPGNHRVILFMGLLLAGIFSRPVPTRRPSWVQRAIDPPVSCTGFHSPLNLMKGPPLPARPAKRPQPVVWILLILLLLTALPSEAREETPQWWSFELKGGIWTPLEATTRDFLGGISPFGMAEFAFLYHARYGAEIGVGYIGASGTAVGAGSGAASVDSFDFTMIPIQNSFVFRADFKEDQFLVPYAKAGLDYVIFRENVQGNVTKGVKLGMHVAGGLQINMDRIEDMSDLMESSLKVNDIYLTLEGRYAFVNGFGGAGVDLSNFMASLGFLFEF